MNKPVIGLCCCVVSCYWIGRFLIKFTLNKHWWNKMWILNSCELWVYHIDSVRMFLPKFDQIQIEFHDSRSVMRWYSYCNIVIVFVMLWWSLFLSMVAAVDWICTQNNGFNNLDGRFHRWSLAIVVVLIQMVGGVVVWYFWLRAITNRPTGSDWAYDDRRVMEPVLQPHIVDRCHTREW